MKVGVVGFGHVGQAVTKGLLLRGHEVMINDTNPKVDYYYEDDETQYQCASKADLMQDCQVIFVCVPTPSKPDGGCDLSIVYKVYSELHKAWTDIALSDEGLHATKHQPVIAVKSTVIPGTVDTLKAMYPWVCSNPEFMREKTALNDFLNPDRIIVGAYKPVVFETMRELYVGFDAPFFNLKPREAEAVKYFSNAFLVTKVAFSQELKSMCALMDVNAETVTQGMIWDHRINESHLDPRPGPMPKDTPCLVKDIRALIQASEMAGYDPWLLKASLYRGVEDTKIKVKLEVK